MAFVDSALTRDEKTRVEDYLNDQLQSESDLANIDNLLAKVREQQRQLKDQLLQARKEQQRVELEFKKNVETLQERARKHELEQIDLDRRMQTLTRSEVSEDAISKFDQVTTKLRRVDIAEGYINTLRKAEEWDREGHKSVDANPEASIEAYNSLQSLALRLEGAQVSAEGAAPHLVDQISTSAGALHDDIKQNWEKQLRKSLEGIKWPKKELNLLGEPIKGWVQHTTLLLKLEEPLLLREALKASENIVKDPVVLSPLAVMAQPLALRFRFHFYGDKPTNRLDKPEYFLSHILDLLEQHNGFLTDFIQPILDERVLRDERLDMVYTDATSSFISALLPIVTAKCLSILPQLTSQPQLMSHFMNELMSFDESLQQSWAYSPYPGPLTQWKGITWHILTKHGYFDAWLGLEKDFALSRYKKIRDDPESNKIDYDGVEGSRTKPTKGAIRVNDLLETITDRYRRLTSFTQKMDFLIKVQLFIFDDYHGYLHGAFQAYRTSSHTAGRMLSGQSADDAMGSKGLETLLKVFGSAEYLERKMSDWSDDVFFLEMWEELQDRASQNSGTKRRVGRDLSIDEVAAKTSASIRNADEILESEGGALFDETAASYRRLRELSEAETVRLFEVNVRNAIRPFLEVSIWASLSTTSSDISQLAPTSALDSFDHVTSPLFSVLAKVLAAGPLRRVVKKACQTIQTEIYDRLLMKYNFSAAGANQLKRDMFALTSSIDRSISMNGEAAKYFTKIDNSITLLSLPVKASGKKSIAKQETEDDWGFDDEDEAEDADAGPNDFPDDESWGLWQAEKAIFADNVSARSALESMGLTELSEVEARNIIRRRIEINS